MGKRNNAYAALKRATEKVARGADDDRFQPRNVGHRFEKKLGACLLRVGYRFIPTQEFNLQPPGCHLAFSVSSAIEDGKKVDLWLWDNESKEWLRMDVTISRLEADRKAQTHPPLGVFYAYIDPDLVDKAYKNGRLHCCTQVASILWHNIREQTQSRRFVKSIPCFDSVTTQEAEQIIV